MLRQQRREVEELENGGKRVGKKVRKMPEG